MSHASLQNKALFVYEFAGTPFHCKDLIHVPLRNCNGQNYGNEYHFRHFSNCILLYLIHCKNYRIKMLSFCKIWISLMWNDVELIRYQNHFYIDLVIMLSSIMCYTMRHERSKFFILLNPRKLHLVVVKKCSMSTL